MDALVGIMQNALIQDANAAPPNCCALSPSISLQATPGYAYLLTTGAG